MAALRGDFAMCPEHCFGTIGSCSQQIGAQGTYSFSLLGAFSEMFANDVVRVGMRAGGTLRCSCPN